MSFNLSRRRLRSGEWSDDIAHMRDLNERINKFRRIFDRVMRDNSIHGDPYLQFDERVSQTALQGQYVDVIYTPLGEANDLLIALKTLQGYIEGTIRHAYMTSPHGAINFFIEITSHYYAASDDTKQSDPVFVSKNYDIYQSSDILDAVKAVLGDIISQDDQYQHTRSDWVFDYLIFAILKYTHKRPSKAVRGGGGRSIWASYKRGKRYIAATKWVQNKFCTLNIKNEDDYCFKYCLEAALMKKDVNCKTLKKPNEVHHYKKLNNFEYGDLNFPIGIMDLEKFEQINKNRYNIALHVWTVTDTLHDISILYCSKNIDEHAWHIHLMLIDDEKKDITTNTHWILITSIGKLLSSRELGNTNGKKSWCFRCGSDFRKKESLDRHVLDCMKIGDPAIPIMPYEYDKYKTFTDYHKMLVQPFVTYADFEAFNVDIEHKDNESKTFENMVGEHVAASYAFHTVCRLDSKYNRTVLFTYDLDEISDKELIAREFIKAMDEERIRCENIVNKIANYKMDGDQTIFPLKDDTNCAICKLHIHHGEHRFWSYTTVKREPNSKIRYSRMRDMKRKPLSNEMRQTLLEENKKPELIWDYTKEKDNIIGWAHSACTRKRPGYHDYRYQHKVIFHNLVGYDSHFILKALNPDSINFENKFSALSQAGDKFMNFSYNRISYMDSLKFMKESLEKLVKNVLKSGMDKFKNFNSFEKFLNIDNDMKQVLLQKGEFPYDYFKHPNIFNETQLPSKESFFNKLTNSPIKDEDYDKAWKVWLKMGCKTFKDYHDLYLYQDVLLLADVFENFRDVCLNQDQLDPCNYISLPQYTMDSAFIFANKTPKIRDETGIQRPFAIELFTRDQHDMYMFIEDSIRGGVSMIPGRYSKANHKYLENFIPNEESKHIYYYDANNLYGYAMIQKLPIGGYRWVNGKEFEWKSKYYNMIEDHSSIGYIYEVDGYFPICSDVEKNHEDPNCTCNHDYLKDFPPVPEKLTVEECKTSECYKSMCQRYQADHDDKSKKLLCTLESKYKYKVYYKTLKLYEDLGFKVTKVHRILAFRQSNWMSDYINYNTNQRAKATSSFEKDFYKLKNNASYGKFIQNNRKFTNCKVLPKFDKDNKNTYSKGLLSWRIINENFVIGYFSKGKVELNSPVAVGSVILDHSKWLMYNFYYNVIKNEFLLPISSR